MNSRFIQILVWPLLVAIFWTCSAQIPRAAANEPSPIVLNDDGAWCWFQDERAIVYGSVLLVGSVANGTHEKSRRGDIDLTAYDFDSHGLTHTVLHEQLEADDHDAPALWMRPDGRLLAVYAKHGTENCFYSRVTRRAGNFGDWTPKTTFVPSTNSQLTYSNLQFVTGENELGGRLYNFFRGLHGSFKPSYAYSDDLGQSWQTGHVVVDVPVAFRHRPYAKYCSDGKTVHIVYTEGHPRDFDNSLYHIYLRDGQLCQSDGAAIGALSCGLKTPEQGTCIFRGDAQNVAWISDVHLSLDGRPYVVYSVQKDSGGLKSADERAGSDHRYRYAWWDGVQWHDQEIGHGGSRLYAGEDDYTGNICLDPNHLDTVYFSTNADPMTGDDLVRAGDGQRHYELYRGRTSNGCQSWSFEPITRNSTQDNLRPIVPKSDTGRTALLWFRGKYRSYRDYQTEVVALVVDSN